MGVVRGRHAGWSWVTAAGVLLLLLAGCGRREPLPSEPAGKAVAPPAPAEAEPAGYPRIPGAVSAPPAWLMAEAPFDLKELFEQVPPGENAAPLYLEALVEFNSEVVSCFPQDQQAALRERVRPRSQEFDRVSIDWADGRAVDPAEVDRVLAGFEPGFEKLARAQQRPRCVFETGITVTTLLPHAQSVRQVAQVVHLRNSRDLRRGEFRRPIQALEMLLRLNRDLQVRALLITQLVGAAVQTVAQKAVLDILAAPGLTREHTDRLLGVLTRDDRAAQPYPLVGAYQLEYVLNRMLVHDVEHRTGDCAPDAVERWTKNNNVPPTVGNALASFLEQIRGPSPEGRAAKQIDARLALMTADDYRREARAITDHFRGVVEAVRLPYPQQAAALDKLAPEQKKSFFLSLLGDLLPQANLGVVRGQATRQGTLCLAALRRWQFDNPGVPADLAAVVKAAGLPAVPTDPFSGGPMRLAVVDGAPVVYSVGADGRDDGARVDWNNGQQPGDFIFRLRERPPSAAGTGAGR